MGVRELPGYAYLRLPLAEVKPAILNHPEFAAFNRAATQRFTEWRAIITPKLTAFDQDYHPKALIETIAEALLDTYKAETMQDDCYLIAAVGGRTQR